MLLKLNFLKRILTDSIENHEIAESFYETKEFPSISIMEETLNQPLNPLRLGGLDWPEKAHTMIGLKRLDNLHECLDFVRENKIDGDLIETGVWRGGATIFMRMYCKLYDLEKRVFVADSFEGLPKPEIPEDNGDYHYKYDFLKVSLEEVKKNFDLYGVLDNNVVFLKGWFSETLYNNDQIKSLSILRMDGDMYKSTMDVFNSCYDKLVSKGFVIVDDYNAVQGCQRATIDFRKNREIKDELKVIDGCGVFWHKDGHLLI